MKKLSKLLALSMTAGMLLAACGDMEEDPGMDDPGMEEDMNGDLEDDGMDDGLEDEGMDDEDV